MTYTLNQIVQANKKAGGCFFKPETMRFFGDRMTSFKVINYEGHSYVCRKPQATVEVFGEKKHAGRLYFGAWEFNPTTGGLDSVGAELEAKLFEIV